MKSSLYSIFAGFALLATACHPGSDGDTTTKYNAASVTSDSSNNKPIHADYVTKDSISQYSAGDSTKANHDTLH